MYPAYADTYLLLDRIYEKQGNRPETKSEHDKALAADGVTNGHKNAI